LVAIRPSPAGQTSGREKAMVFWAVVGVVVLLVLFAAWRKDHKHHVTISRTEGDVERDIGDAWGGFH